MDFCYAYEVFGEIVKKLVHFIEMGIKFLTPLKEFRSSKFRNEIHDFKWTFIHKEKVNIRIQWTGNDSCFSYSYLVSTQGIGAHFVLPCHLISVLSFDLSK